MDINSMKILLCDDSAFVRSREREFLLSIGVKEVFEASGGKEAIDSYKEHRPDLVFMDIVMPGLDGISALKQIMAFDKDAKIVMASSAGTQTNLISAIEAGAIEFVQKPFDFDVIREIAYDIAEGRI